MGTNVVYRLGTDVDYRLGKDVCYRLGVAGRLFTVTRGKETKKLGFENRAQSEPLKRRSLFPTDRKAIEGWAWWLMPVIPALWEAKVGRLPGGQKFETSLAKKQNLKIN